MGWDSSDIGAILADIDAVEVAGDAETLLRELSRALGRWGFEQVVLLQLINPASARKPLPSYGITNYPDEWIARWFENERAMHDPILRFGAGARTAFEWDDARRYASHFGRRLMDEGRDYGLRDGIGVPVTIPKLPTGLVAMPKGNVDLSPRDLLQIELLSIHAYTRFLQLSDTKPEASGPELTERETVIMHYAAIGKTNWEIGEILSISSDTVGFHLKNITRKLNTSNRAHSVAVSMKEGRILP